MARTLVALAAAIALTGMPAQAQDAAPDGANLWRQMAETDSTAALRLITDNHPGRTARTG